MLGYNQQHDTSLQSCIVCTSMEACQHQIYVPRVEKMAYLPAKQQKPDSKCPCVHRPTLASACFAPHSSIGPCSSALSLSTAAFSPSSSTMRATGTPLVRPWLFLTYYTFGEDKFSLSTPLGGSISASQHLWGSCAHFHQEGLFWHLTCRATKFVPL